ncbi:acid beta-fructofuranosidase 1, vacuolar-like isoform X2 [Syzygium oleosum]|uniref:acid beta-fructofuranosidase 1, vacuolar-like isoform X2 n=1 Tax=Syzygium oleosum TaxID=219896 RepID=UPI0024BB8DF4|nr:acid beta-fructofuranosidase 1, vacuolar-like isoform X2 [Syzygium oleosum]
MENSPSHNNAPYTLLPEDPSPTRPPARFRRPLKVFAATVASVVFLMSLVGLIINQSPGTPAKSDHRRSDPLASKATSFSEDEGRLPTGVSQGVSAKSYPSVRDRLSYNWTNAMFSFQRTAYHFQPEKNWMNGPLFYMGWYHLFYQYNPDSAVWGNITWGHAVSRDLIHWLYLPLAMVPDSSFDAGGVWTGSATLLPDGRIMVLYTGDTEQSIQVQNLAYPANLSDPLLLDWVKYPGNPVIAPPAGIEPDEFRDPTTAWMGPDGTWRVLIGTKVNDTGMALIYQTSNFTTYKAAAGVLHAVNGTGMWECVDFYPVSTNSPEGLDTSAVGPGVKHVLKASLDDLKLDYYAIGTYDPISDTWTPDDPEADVGIGLQVDYGRYYASKSFFDQNTGRRILWGWTNETDADYDDLAKGWASVQTIPRVVTFDNKTGANIIEWPVEEVESLRLNSTEFDSILVEAGSVVALDIGMATQLDISVEFEIEGSDALEALEETEAEIECATARNRTTLGPFGLLVLADESLSEFTPIYFHIAKSTNGSLTTLFCADETRSSKASEVFRQVYGGSVPVLDDEKFTMRLLVDHSIVESFAQGGRTVITSRVYPTEAIYGAAKLFLFNNATGVNVTASLEIWQMNSAFIHPFPLEEM